MAYQTIRFRLWKIRFDDDATREFYNQRKRQRAAGEKLKYGRCSCENCGNFTVAEPRVYPSEFLTLCRTLGIDPHYEVELLAHKAKPGLWVYTGWLPFVGERVSGPGDRQDDALGDNFTVGFVQEERLFSPKRFAGELVVELVYTTKVPWVLDAPEP